MSSWKPWKLLLPAARSLRIGFAINSGSVPEGDGVTSTAPWDHLVGISALLLLNAVQDPYGVPA